MDKTGFAFAFLLTNSTSALAVQLPLFVVIAFDLQSADASNDNRVIATDARLIAFDVPAFVISFRTRDTFDVDHLQRLRAFQLLHALSIQSDKSVFAKTFLLTFAIAKTVSIISFAFRTMDVQLFVLVAVLLLHTFPI